MGKELEFSAVIAEALLLASYNKTLWRRSVSCRRRPRTI
jgi:hypothetical protein